MAERAANPIRRGGRRKPQPVQSGPVTPDLVAEELPRILGPRARDLVLPDAAIAALAATVEAGRRAYGREAQPPADVERAASARRLLAAAADARAHGIEVPDGALDGARAAADVPRWRWVKQDHAALTLAREFQDIVRFEIPAADLGMGGATARFTAWAMTRITGATASPDSVPRQAKRANAKIKTAMASVKKVLQDKDLRGDKQKDALSLIAKDK